MSQYRLFERPARQCLCEGLTVDSLACLVATVMGAYLVWAHFPAGGNDDSCISYWSAYALSEYGRLLNYNGEPIEQSSSLLLVILLAALRSVFGLEPQRAGPLLGIVAGLLTLPAAVWLGRVSRVQSRYAIPLLLGVWTPFIYWSTSGMETSLVALVSLLAIASVCKCIDPLTAPRARASVMATALLLATSIARPETGLVLLASLAGLLAVRLGQALARQRQVMSVDVGRIIVWLGVLGLLIGTVVILRMIAFGSASPSPALAKSHSFDWEKGIDYLRSTVELSGVLFAILASGGALVVLERLVQGRASIVAPYRA